MIKNFKRLVSIILLYAIVFTVIPMNLLKVEATENIRDFSKQFQKGYVSGFFYGKNKMIFDVRHQKSPLGKNYNYRNGNLTEISLEGYDIVSKKYIVLNPLEDNPMLYEMETNTKTSLKSVYAQLEKKLENKYNVKEAKVEIIKSLDDELWFKFHILDEKKGIKKYGLVNRDFSKILLNDKANNYGIIQSNGNFFGILNYDEEAGIIKKYILQMNGNEIEVKGDYILEIYEDYFYQLSDDFKFINKYKIEGKEVKKIKSIKSPNGENFHNVSFEIDRNGKFYILNIDNGYLYKENNDKFELKYKLGEETYIDHIYDENNFLVGKINHGSDTYVYKYLSVMDGKVSNYYFWDKNENNKWILKNFNHEIQKGWAEVSGKWYYLDEKTGEMLTGWKKVKGKDYFMDKNGVMQKNKWIGDYYVGNDGACYYNKWAGDYYCGTDGKYVKNKWVGDYYCGTDGKYVKNKWVGSYYCGSNGKYVKNKWVGSYYCESNGKYVKNKWIGNYYCGTDGKYVKNKWVKTSGKWYYCGGDGKYIKNTSRKIGNKTYKFDKNGVCLNP